MNFKDITLAQALVLVACLAGTFAAYKFLGTDAAGVAATISMVWTFMLGRKDPPAPPPSKGDDNVSGPSAPIGFVSMLSLLTLLVACVSALTPAQVADLAGTQAQIEKCKTEGRACKADGGKGCYDVYDRCMKDAGLHE